MKNRLILLALLLLTQLVSNSQSAYPKMDEEIKTFMKDGGWCWYESPRAIIHNGKLIIGAISGVSGDIRVGVFDLKTNKTLELAF